MNFFSFILRRLILMIIVLVGVGCIVFVVSRVIPADPVGAILGGNAPVEVVDRMRAQLGYDRPIAVQFLDFIQGAIRLDFGVSLRTNRPVMTDIMEYFPVTMELAIVAIFISIFTGVVLGVLSAVYRNRWIDQFSRVFSIFGVSMPVFWTGLMLILVFYGILGWLPGAGQYDWMIELDNPLTQITGMRLLDSLLQGNWHAFWDAFRHIILPAIVLGLTATAIIARITRASMLDVLKQDYIRTAKAKGLKKRVVILRHALRNSLIPTVTVIGLTFGSLLEGAVLTETVFSRQGLGRYITNGLLGLDYPAVTGGTLYIALIYCLANLIVDIVYAILDPRMRS